MNHRTLTLTLLGCTLGLTLTAQAKNIQPVLTDPVTDAPLPNTPYFLGIANEKTQTQPQITNAKGQTRVVKTEPDILVEAEGFGKQVFISNLSIAQEDDTEVTKGAPYMVFNRANNQSLCGRVNAKGFTHAYFMDNAQLWYDNSLIIQLKDPQKCADARSTVNQLLGNDSERFAAAYDAAPQKLALSKKQHTEFLYAHIDSIIKDKTIDIDNRAASSIIKKGIKVALADQNSERLNGIGYSLGFERQAYKQGLKLLDESLRIKPKDCYASNSKGYLLMRKGDLIDARPYFYDSDEACKLDAIANKDNPKSTDYDYPQAVNYAHLAENYARSGDEFLANDFFSRALKISSKAAKDEIIEVAKQLREQKTLTPENIELLVLYLQYAEREDEIERPAAQAPQKKVLKKRKK